MRRMITWAAAIAIASIGGHRIAAQRAPTPAAAPLIDYTTDGGDPQRTGWIRDEKILTKDNVGSLKAQWKRETGNEPRALHALMPVLIASRPGPGVRQLAIVAGISDNIVAFEADTGRIAWRRQWDYPGQVVAGQDPRHLGFLRPGGSSDTPVIGPPDAQGRRPVYFVTGDGMMHTLNAADGSDLVPPYMFHIGKGWSLNLVGNVLWMANTYAGISIGGAWGRRGAAIDASGTAWFTTGDGIYDPTSDPPRYGNSVVGVHLVGDELKLKSYFAPKNWEWLRKRDLDPNNTPTVFLYKGRELIAASGKECRMFLLDPKAAGGADNQTPLYKSELFCNEEVDFQDAGSWGALSTWEDSVGNRWILAPFWGPVHSKFKFEVTHGPVVAGGVGGFKLRERNGKYDMTPVWVSADMKRGEPVVIANGMVFGYGSGEETKQSWPDIGLNFDSSIRAAKSTHATLYVLDGQTGEELYSSGDQITSFNHFSGLTVVNGRVYIGTYDGTLYCFGLEDASRSQ
jgi:outer membrane protein assembly factor BamB